MSNEVADRHTRVNLDSGARDDLLYDVADGAPAGYALVRRSGLSTPRSIDLLGRSSVKLDGKTSLEASQSLENAYIEYDGTPCVSTYIAQRTAKPSPTGTAAGTVTMTVYAPGVRTVLLNNLKVTPPPPPRAISRSPSPEPQQTSFGPEPSAHTDGSGRSPAPIHRYLTPIGAAMAAGRRHSVHALPRRVSGG